MERDELAKQFAKQKAVELGKMIKEAYLKGYEQGQLDAGVPIIIDGVQYVDMGLPSGTLWSKTYLYYCDYGYRQKRLSFQEAQNLPLPTQEQWNEIQKFCVFDKENIIGLSGGRIGYTRAPAGYYIRDLGEGCEENHNMFWLKGDIDNDHKAPTMIYDLKIVKNNQIVYTFKGSSRHFIGYKLPVFLVKNKE